MQSQLTRGVRRLPSLILQSILSLRAALSSFRLPILGVASFGLTLLVCWIGVPSQARAQSSSQPAQSSASSSSTREQTSREEQASRRALTSRRMQTKLRREAAVVTDTYTHRWEVYLGGQYMRFRPGPDLHNSGMGGWILGATRYFSPRWGITADARGNFGNNSLGATSGGGFNTYNTKFDVYTFTIGPQYRFYGSPKFSISAAVQAGDVYGYFDKNTGPFAPPLVGLYPAGNVPGGIASLNLDYNLSPALAVRIAPIVLFDHFAGNTDHNQGFMMGVIYRFGRQ